MRNAVISTLLLLATTIAASPPEILAPFGDAALATLEERYADGNETSDELEKRQSGCAGGYSNCFQLGAPGLCCRDETVCALDGAGRVGCCPERAVCTGTLGPGAPTPTSGGQTFVFPTTTGATSTQGFIVADPTDVTGAGYSRSTVPNSYFPYAYIPTTYTDAAACSSAYTSCQTDAAKCTSALAGGGNGVTVVAPNGGVTVQPVMTLPSAQASSVCASLSSQACYGLQVAACASFGGDSGAGGVGCQRVMYGVGAGVAIGMAGQLL